MMLVEAAAAASPYKFLDFFAESESEYFAGRDEEIRELVARVSSERVLVFYGRSGIGKTSLLLAGVFPRLRERHFLPVHVRVLDDPLLALRNAVAAAIGLPASLNAEDLPELLKAAAGAAAGGTVVVFDQFEEYFIRQRQHPREAPVLLETLASVVAQVPTLRVVFSLREDYLAEMDDLKGSFPDILRNTFRLHPLTAFGARQAITAPLIRLGIAYEPRLVHRLVDLLAEAGFDPVLLQIACTELYREASARGPDVHLTEADLEAIGGLDGIFNRYLLTAIANVPNDQMLLSRAILDALITPEDTKRAVRFEDLGSYGDFVASAEEIRTVLSCLMDQRLVRSDMRADKVWYELSHERLVRSILGWFRYDREFSRFRSARDLIANATRDDGFRNNAELLLAEGQVRELIWPRRMRLRLNDTEREFMFRTAVYRRLEGVEYWAEGLGHERCRDILLAMLADERVDARAGAAAVAGVCGETAELRQACLTAALEDPDEKVRRCAGRSLASMVGAEETARIALALKTPATRRRALDLLADCAEARKPIGGVSLYWRMRARRSVRRRALGRHRDTIHARTVRGALIGLLTGVGWAATCGVVSMVALAWISGEPDWLEWAAKTTSYAGALAVFLGAWFGASLGRASAKRAAIRGDEHQWFLPAVKLARPVAIFAVLLAVGAWLDSGPEAALAAAVALGLVVHVIVAAGYVRAARAAAWWPGRTAEWALWGVLTGLGPPLLLALLWVAGVRAFVTVMDAQPDAGITAGLVGVLLSLPLGFLAMLMMIVLSDTAVTRIGPPTPVSLSAKRLSRRVLAASAAALLPGYVLLFGFDSIPWFAKRHVVPSTEPVQIRLRQRQPDSMYFRVRPKSGSPEWYVVRRPTEGRAVSIAGQSLLRSGTTLMALGGRGTLFGTSAFGWSNTEADQIEFQQVRTLPEKDTLLLRSREWTPVVMTLNASREPGSRRWRADWRGRVGAQANEGRVDFLRVLPVTSSDLRLTGKLVLVNEQVGTVAPSAEPPAIDGYGVASLGSPVSFYPRVERRSGSELPSIAIARDGQVELHLEFLTNDLLAGPSISIPLLLAIEGDATRYHADGERYFAQKDYESALTSYLVAAELTPDSAEYQNSVAWTMYVGRDVVKTTPEDTLAYARRAANLAPQSAYILDTLAHAAHLAGQAEEAAVAWEKVVQLMPNYYVTDLDPVCANDLKMFTEAAQKAGRPISPATIALFSRRPTGR